MARRRSEPNQSFDSLLDTMANVVGIFVVLLAVTQISVGEAVGRLRDAAMAALPTEEERDAMAARSVSLQERLAALRAEWVSLAPAAAAEPSEQPSPKTLSAKEGELAALSEEVARIRGELSRIAVLADDVQDDALTKAIHVRLPDPRPPPDDAQRIVFYCWGGRVVPVDEAAAVSELDRAWRTVTGRGVRDPSFDAFDVGKVERYFGANPVGWGPLRWSVHVGGPTGVEVRFGWAVDGAGEDVPQLIEANSAFRAFLSRSHPRTHYVRFWVWPDSFRAYLSARRVAEERGLAVSWDAVPEGQDHLLYTVHARRDEVD